MGRREEYREELSSASDVVAFLRVHSGLPGPRGNLEVLEAAAENWRLERLAVVDRNGKVQPVPEWMGEKDEG